MTMENDLEGLGNDDVEDVLVELEKRVANGVFRDWREAGEALEQIRDERLYRREYPSFAEYVDARFGLHRTTAYGFIQAAVVVRELSAHDDSPQLPQRHAQLLYRFDAATRREMARKIGRLSFRDASKLVIDRATEKKQIAVEAREPHRPDADLQSLGDVLRAINSLDIERAGSRISEMNVAHALKERRDIRLAVGRLQAVLDMSVVGGSSE